MSKLTKNWSYLLASDISQSVISFFVFMFLARKLSPEGYGMLNTIIALAAIFSVFATNFSANQVITREVTLQPASTKNIFRTVLFIRLISLLLTIISLIVYQYINGVSQSGFIIASVIIVISTLIWDLAESIAFGHFVTKFTTMISIVGSLCWLIVVLLLPSKNIKVEQVVIIYALILLVRSFTYLGFDYKKFIEPNNEVSNVGLKAILLMSFPYLWMRIVGTFSEQIPILLLNGYSGAKEVGYFTVGSRLIMPITLAVTTGLRAVFPFMTKLYQENRDDFNNKILLGFTFILIIGATIAAVLTTTSGLWIPFFLGNIYQKAVQAFNYQAWFGVLLSFDLILSNVLSSTYRQKTLAIITTIDIFIIFPLLYLGTKYGADGMAIAKLIGALITVLYHIVVVVVVLNIKLNSKPFILSIIYFMILILSTVFIEEIIFKLIIVGLTIGFYMIIKDSPVKSMVNLIVEKIRGKVN